MDEALGIYPKAMDLFYKLIFDYQKGIRIFLAESGVNESTDISKSIRLTSSESVVTMYAYDYYQSLSAGRKPKAKKIPIEDLLQWIKDKGISTANANSLAYAIQQSIYKHGIKGKQFEQKIINNLTDYTAEVVNLIIWASIMDITVAMASTLNELTFMGIKLDVSITQGDVINAASQSFKTLTTIEKIRSKWA